MCAEASTVLRAVAANFFFNCWYLDIPSDNHIRHVTKVRPLSCTRFSVGDILEFLCWNLTLVPNCAAVVVFFFFFFLKLCAYDLDKHQTV
jgi:hypothetical protein